MPAVLDLVPYLLLFLALAIVLSLRAFIQITQIIVNKVAGPFGFVGDIFSSGFNAVASSITRVCDALIKDIDKGIGWSWHVTASMVDWFSTQFKEAAHVSAQIAQTLYQFASKDYLTALVRELRRLVHAASHVGSVAFHETVVINKKADKALAHDVLPRLKALERETAHVLEPELKGLRHAERTLTRDLTALERYVRAHPWTAVTEAFVGAVAVAIGKLGLDWIRCSSARGIFQKRGCNLWNDLDSLLGLLVDVAFVASICDVIPVLETVFSTVASPLIGALAGVGAGLCSGSAGPPETLPPPGLVTPPLQALNAGLP